MLRITLYKNCILNETYQNVISTAIKNGKSVLERYLETLNSYNLPDLEDVYYENSGKLNFDLELVNLQDIYQYNYMKILYYDEDGTLLLKRYGFIQNIEVKNEIVYLTYEEDIFSSYSNEITKLTESYLSRSRKLRYSNKTIDLHTLPINYDGNKALNYIKDNHQKFYVLSTIQYYSASTFGSSTKRFSETFLLGYIRQYHAPKTEDDPTFDEQIVKELTLSQCLEMCYWLIANQSEGFVKRGEESFDTGYYYKLESFKIIPYDSILGLFLSTYNRYIDEGNTTRLFRYVILYKPFSSIMYNKETFYTENIPNNFKRISFGTFNSQLPIINNGLDFTAKLSINLEDEQIQIFLECLNQIIDVTEDFTFEVPISAIGGEENSLYRTQRSLKNMSSVIDLISKVWTGGVGINSNLDKISGINQKIEKLKYTKTGRETRSINALAKINKLENQMINLEEDSSSRKIAMLSSSGNGILSLISNNLPYYTSNQGTFAKSTGFINAIYGLTSFIISSINDDFVLKTINNTGYGTYEYCSNLSDIDFYNVSQFVTDNVNYDVIKFETINVIGKFPRSIALILNSIFENGFKIWYNENLQEDNLEVR